MKLKDLKELLDVIDKNNKIWCKTKEEIDKLLKKIMYKKNLFN